MKSRRCLIIDDEASIRRVLADTLREEGFVVRVAAGGKEGLDVAREFRPQVVLLDIRMPDIDGIEVLDKLLAADPACRVIMLTAHGNLRIAVDTMARGAYHYLAKPFDLDEVVLLAKRASREWDLNNQVTVLKRRLADTPSLDDMLGSSPAMQQVFRLIIQAAPTQAAVLISGESGTGKELAARAIHRHSGRSGQFVPVNCAALPVNLLESELFGHVRGAFTGAHQDRQGHVQRAHGGTLFLDEVGELPLELQAKLLRVLQDKKFFPVGGQQEICADFRVVAATNADLEQAVGEGCFRADLYYRLRVISINLPPLRQRREDIALLASQFLDDYNQAYSRSLEFSPAALAWLLSQAWPGNIRQLKNAIHQAVVLCGGQKIEPQDLAQGEVPGRHEDLPTLAEWLADAERKYIRQILAQVDNRSQAAEILGISRKTLYNRIQRLGL